MFRGPEHSSSSLFLATSPCSVVQTGGQLGTRRRVPGRKHLEKIKPNVPILAQHSLLRRKGEQEEARQISTSLISAGERMGADAWSCLPRGPIPSLSIPPEDAILNLAFLISESTKGALLWAGPSHGGVAQVALGDHPWCDLWNKGPRWITEPRGHEGEQSALKPGSGS